MFSNCKSKHSSSTFDFSWNSWTSWLCLLILYFLKYVLIEEDVQITIEGRVHNARWLRMENNDRQTIRDLFQHWRTLTEAMPRLHARKVNFPDGISEATYSLQFACPKIIDVQGSSGSFDCYNPQTRRRLQIKATSVEDDLTSFGPRSVWDDLFFMDFYNNGNYDGSYDLYQIPNELIYNFQINQNETFVDQQNRGIRPRLHMKRHIISRNNINPTGHFRI